MLNLAGRPGYPSKFTGKNEEVVRVLPQGNTQKNFLVPSLYSTTTLNFSNHVGGVLPHQDLTQKSFRAPCSTWSNVPKHHCSHSQCVFTFGFCRQGQGQGNVPERPGLSVIKTRPQATTSRIYEDASIKRHRHQQRRLTAAEQRPR